MHGTLSQPDSSKPVPTSRLPLTLRLALRELRGGLSGFRVFIACIALALLAVAALLGLAGTAPLSGQTEGPGGFRITLLGTGAPRPSFQRYGPSTLIEAGTSRILLDPSWGLRERLMQAGSFELMVGLQHVLLTHLHYDHTVGLPDLWLTGWLYGRRAPLVVGR